MRKRDVTKAAMMVFACLIMYVNVLTYSAVSEVHPRASSRPFLICRPQSLILCHISPLSTTLCDFVVKDFSKQWS